VFASESGNSERLAGDMAKAARKQGFKPNVVDLAELDLATLPKSKRLVVIAATWGEGDPPARAIGKYKELMSNLAPRLDGVEFGVLALGDTAYVEFCAIGKAIDARLAELGGKRVVDRVDCDLDYAEPAARWIKSTLTTLAPAGDADRGRVIEVDFKRQDRARRQCRRSGSGNHRAHQSELVALGQADHSSRARLRRPAPAYQPGDSLDIYPENDPAYVEQVLKAAGLAGDNALRKELTKSRDITTLSLKTVEKYVAATGHQYVKALLDKDEARDWIVGRQLIDLLTHFPIALSADQLRTITRPLAPRAYSIASSRREVGDEAHLLVSFVHYESHGRERRGVTSSQITERLKKGDRLRVKLRPISISRCRRRTATSSWSAPAPASRRSAPSCRSAAPSRPADAPGCSSATAPSPTISSISSNGRTRSRTVR